MDEVTAVRSAYERLTLKQRKFVDAYLGAANGVKVEAARLAGYGSPRSVAWEVANHRGVRAAIEEQLAAHTLESAEILARLSQQGSALYAGFITVDPESKKASVDLERLLAAGLGHLIKKISHGTHGMTVEFYDAQHALELLGKHRRLFVERVEARVEVSEFEGWTDEELDEYARTGKRGAARPRAEGAEPPAA